MVNDRKTATAKITADLCDKWNKMAASLAAVLAVNSVIVSITENEHNQVIVSSEVKGALCRSLQEKMWFERNCQTVEKTQKKFQNSLVTALSNRVNNSSTVSEMVSFLGYPLVNPDQSPFGTVSVLDNQEIIFTSDQEQWLLHFKETIEMDLSYLDLKKQLLAAEEALVLEHQKFSAMVEKADNAEKALFAHRADIAAAFGSMTEAVFITNAVGEIVEFNDAWIAFARFKDKADLINKTSEYPDLFDVSFLDGKVATLDDYAVSRALKGETAKNAEFLIHRKDTDETWIGNYNFSPIRDQSGLIVGTVVVCSDITEQKEAQTQLKELNDTLESRIKERTAQLQASNEELESFAYSVSHDLRAPLRHISGFIDMLSNSLPQPISDKNKHYLQVIDHAAKEMSHLIDGLLSFSRIGRTELVKRRVNPEELIKKSMASFARDTEGRNIDWQIEALPNVKGDSIMLQMVFANLIANAIKFTRLKATATIAIGSLPDTENSDHILFYVKDNGAGFDMRYQEKLFGVFQRLHAQKDFEGIGIGLANVKHIVLRHGGRIWAESDLNNGATFYFTLPKYQEV